MEKVKLFLLIGVCRGRGNFSDGDNLMKSRVEIWVLALFSCHVPLASWRNNLCLDFFICKGRSVLIRIYQQNDRSWCTWKGTVVVKSHTCVTAISNTFLSLRSVKGIAHQPQIWRQHQKFTICHFDPPPESRAQAAHILWTCLIFS